MYRTLLLFALVFIAGQSFAQPLFRLTSVTRKMYSGTANAYITRDSVKYFYSGQNSGMLVFPPLTIGYQYTDMLDPGLLFDSAFVRGFGQSQSRKVFQVVSNSKAEFQVRQFVDGYTERHSFDYDAADRLILRTKEIKSGGLIPKWEFEDQDAYIYDSNGNIEKHEHRWQPGAGGAFSTWTYIYNGSNQLINAAYEENYGSKELIDYTYVNNQLATEVHQAYKPYSNNWSWKTEKIINYTYNTAGLLQSKEEVMYANSKRMESYNYDNAGKLMEARLAWWNNTTGSYEYNSRTQWAYNSSDLPVRAFTEAYDRQSGTWYIHSDSVNSDLELNLEYQLYWPTNVGSVRATPAVNIYPIPATSFININMEWLQPQAFIVSIINMEGKIVKEWKEDRTKKYAKSITLPELAPGNYVIKMSGESEVAQKKVFISR